MPTPADQAAEARLARTAGSFAGFDLAQLRERRGDQRVAADVATTLDRSRKIAVGIDQARLFLALCHNDEFIVSSCRLGSASAFRRSPGGDVSKSRQLDRHAAIDDERLAGRERRLVRGEIDDQRRDFLRACASRPIGWRAMNVLARLDRIGDRR